MTKEKILKTIDNTGKMRYNIDTIKKGDSHHDNPEKNQRRNADRRY